MIEKTVCGRGDLFNGLLTSTLDIFGYRSKLHRMSVVRVVVVRSFVAFFPQQILSNSPNGLLYLAITRGES